MCHLIWMSRIIYLQSLILLYGEASSSTTRMYLGLQQAVLQDIEILDPEHLMESRTVDSSILCMRHCIEVPKCMSFSFNSDAKSCLLFDVVYGSGEMELRRSTQGTTT